MQTKNILIAFAMVLAIAGNAHASWCYQENVTNNTCGGSTTGGYQMIMGTWSSVPSVFDGSWTTYSTGTTGESGCIYVNYSKPGTSSNLTGSLWQIKTGNNTGSYTLNVSLPYNCLSQNQLRLLISYNSTPMMQLQCLTTDTTPPDCRYATNAVNLTSPRFWTTDYRVYEEAMYWNVSNVSASISQTSQPMGVNNQYATNITVSETTYGSLPIYNCGINYNATWNQSIPCIGSPYTQTLSPVLTRGWWNITFWANNTRGENATANIGFWVNDTFVINFDQNVNATLLSPSLTANVTNVTNVNYSNTNLPMGWITITFGRTTQNQQVEFNYDPAVTNYTTTYNVHVETPTYIQKFTVLGGGTRLQDAYIKAEVNNYPSWITTYIDHTDQSGVGYIKVVEGNSYKITASATGYATNATIIPNFPTGGYSNIQFDLTPTTTTSTGNTFYSTCPPTINTPLQCGYAFITSNYYNTIQLNTTWGDGTTTLTTATSTTGITANYWVGNTTSTDNVTLTIYLNGAAGPQLSTNYQNMTTTLNQIKIADLTMATLRTNTSYGIPAYIILFLVAIIIGVWSSNKFPGNEVNVVMVMMTLFAAIGFWGFWIPVIPTAAIKALDKGREWVSNQKS